MSSVLAWLRRPLPGYALAVVATLVVSVAVASMRSIVDFLAAPPFMLLVAVVAWFAGFGPAAVTVILSTAMIDYVFQPAPALRWHDVVWIIPFTVVGLTIAWLAATRRRVQDRERAARAEAERVAERLRAAQSIVDAASPRVSLEVLLDTMLARVRAALGSDTATVLLLDEPAGVLVPVASDGLREEFDEHTLVPLGVGVAGRIATSEAGMVVDDLATVDVASPFLRTRVRSVVGVPLRTGERLVGVIHVGSASPHRFTQDDLSLLRLVAGRAALAVDRARLMDAERTARAAAEAANRAKDDFLAVLGHELRNPLSATIHVSVTSEDRDAVLRVRDSGVGIPPDLLSRVFDLFVQGDPASDRARGGLGIGLSVVRRLVELHGGTVEAASDGPARGSTFTVRLPRAAPPAAPSLPSDATPAGPPRRVLVAEDDRDVRTMLRELLESFGHEVFEAEDGVSAVTAMLERRPDVALIDLAMPGMDGWAVARRVRESPDGRSVVLVALTGYGRDEDIRHSREAGFTDHLVKPVDPDRLVAILAAAGSGAGRP